jgi:hypothetical protein
MDWENERSHYSIIHLLSAKDEQKHDYWPSCAKNIDKIHMVVNMNKQFRCGAVQHFSRTGLLYSDLQKSSFIHL